jgi:dolichol-phosphate mannosyltransferase
MTLRTLELQKRSIKDERSVSIIIPCFNEAEGIELLKQQILPVLIRLRLTRSVELICVDDGSTDETFAKLQQHLGDHAQIIRHSHNQGLSAAIQTGLAHSTGEIVCTADSDCTYAPEQLIPMLNLMQEDVDIVTASPYHPKGRVKNVPAWRLFLSKGLSRLYGVVLPCRLYTYTSMFRAYRREVLETVSATHPGFLGLVEVLAEAMLSGYQVVEYPAELRRRVFGQSKLRIARVIWSHLKYIGKLMIRRSLKQQKVKVVRYNYAPNDSRG